ncbi:hypothetical protein MP228_009209 [Amoeboaphelidium protococcarum]|nr:hypothetical protein MP228_009926 [Amoeboaphelidium protococcarum]KAI3646281.1 hypothetical protein MP228_009209 [Amoeboaphelidium protococcarum]
MASLVKSLAAYSEYKDRYFKGTQEEYAVAIKNSATVYVGNLSFYTTEEQLYAAFSRVGNEASIRKIIMGLDRHQLTPCGFCFVEFYKREDAFSAIKYLSGTKLDDRHIRIDLDPGFTDGRQYGRGKSGGQVRDEMRDDFDEGRGGYGKRARQQEDSSYGYQDRGGYQNSYNNQPRSKRYRQ